MFSPNYRQSISLNPPFSVPDSLEEAISLSQKIAYLISNDHYLIPEPDRIIKSINHSLSEILDFAFKEEDSQSLLEVHKTLYSIYEIYFSHPLSKLCLHQNSPWLLSIRNKIEKVWLNYEVKSAESYFPDTLVEGNLKLFHDWFIKEAYSQSNVDKLILDFLENKASIDDFNIFILSDAPLNYRFFDILSLSLVYFSEEIKHEIISNMWDECGHGIIEGFHTQQFTSMLSKLKLSLPRVPIWEDWRPYSGYNLNLCFALNRRYYFRGIGSLAMPELFDPARNRSVVVGLERVHPTSKIDCEYFYNHIEVDEGHGLQWLDRIIMPIIKTYPEAGKEIVIGAALRMVAMRRYNHYLAYKFGLSHEGEYQENEELHAERFGSVVL